MAALHEIAAAALSLEPDDRAALAHQLLASLDDLTTEEADRLWAGEAQRRLDGLRSGRPESELSRRLPSL
jgi:hypothetical protein